MVHTRDTAFLSMSPADVLSLRWCALGGFCPLQLIAILPLAVVHTLGNAFTNMSLGKVAVSFTHTIKALEPFFSVILSALVLGDVRCTRPACSDQLLCFYLVMLHCAMLSLSRTG